MTLYELYEHVVPAFHPTTRKDLKTAISVLARALAYSHPRACPLEALNHPLPTLYRLVEQHLHTQGKGPHTVRNVKNNLSRLFRLAQAQGLFTLVPPTPTPQFHPRHKPRRPGSEANKRDGTYLPLTHWPPGLRADFAAWAKWGTDPLVEGRDSRWKKRRATLVSYQRYLEAYFGYLHHVRQLALLTFDQLFELPLVRAYIHWHVNERHQRPTALVHNFLQCLLTLTRQYRPQPALREQIQALLRFIPKPPPAFNKNDAWVPLAELERIGAALWPPKPPAKWRSGNGRLFARRAGLSLMLRLWVYIPYRQRNMREMRLHENLYRDAHGHWRIKFAGEQMKVAVKRGQPNVFDLPFPEPLVPALEEYLRVWHPLLTAGATTPAPHLFLTRDGRPFEAVQLCRATRHLVYRYTRKHWHPHIVRSVWATEWIRDTRGDFYKAAVMLNDRLETVIKNYAHLLEDNVAEDVFQRVHARLTGHGPYMRAS